MHRNVLYILLISAVSVFGCTSNNNTSTSSDAGEISNDNPSNTGNTDGINNTDNTSVALDTIREDLLHELAGYQNESLSEKLYELVASVESAGMVDESRGTIVSTDTVSFDEPSTLRSYDCQSGGTMVAENSSDVENIGGGASESNDYNHYIFNQCVTAINEGSLANGNYELNGSYTYEIHSRGAVAGVYKILVATWSSFKLQPTTAILDGITYEFDGTLSLDSTSNPSGTTATRNSQINRYAESTGDSVNLELTSADFYQYRKPIHFPGRIEGPRIVRFNGIYTGPLSQSETLQITTDPEFTEWKSDDADFSEPLTGSLQISSTDGGALTMNANGSLIISFLSADGTTSESNLDELPVFDFRGAGCVPDSDDINEMTIDVCTF